MKIACITVDITPQVRCPLGGGKSPETDWRHLESQLEANLLLIEDECGLRLLVTLDLLYVGEYLTNGIRESAMRYVSSDNVWISASHTHNAPATDKGKPLLGIPNDNFLSSTLEKIQNSIETLFKESQKFEAKVIIREGLGNHTIHRRKRKLISVSRKGLTWNRVLLAPNEKGPRDERIRRLDFVKPSGAVVASLWHFTCHPVSHFGELTISSGFPGVVRKKMRMELGQIPVLFLNGFAGDVRPPAIRTMRDNPIIYLLLGRTFRRFTRKEYLEWTSSLAHKVWAAREVQVQNVQEKFSTKRITVDSSQFVFESPTKNVVLHFFPVGNVLLVGISAEPSVELGFILSGKDEYQNIWPCGYLEEVFGYLPTSRQIEEGGYEGGEFVRFFAAKSINQQAYSNFRKLISTQLKTMY